MAYLVAPCSTKKVQITYVRLSRTVYIHTVYDRIFGGFPAKNIVYKPHIGIWFWPTLTTLKTTYGSGQISTPSGACSRWCCDLAAACSRWWCWVACGERVQTFACCSLYSGTRTPDLLAHTHTHTRIRTHTHAHAHTHTYAHAHAHAYMSVHTPINIHTYKHTRKHKHAC